MTGVHSRTDMLALWSSSWASPWVAGPWSTVDASVWSPLVFGLDFFAPGNSYLRDQTCWGRDTAVLRSGRFRSGAENTFVRSERARFRDHPVWQKIIGWEFRKVYPRWRVRFSCQWTKDKSVQLASPPSLKEKDVNIPFFSSFFFLSHRVLNLPVRSRK